MSAGNRLGRRERLAVLLLRCYPPAWRQQYELEMRELTTQNPPPARDLLDLLRSALCEWHREISRGPFRLLEALVAAYLVLVVSYLTFFGLSDFLRGARWSDLGPGDRLPDFLAMAAMFFGADLVLNSPILFALWLARRRLSPGFARTAAAASLTWWPLWVMYRLDWHDVWQHGTPGLSYWLGFVPFALFFAAAGAIVGGGLVRRPDDKLTRVNSPTL